MEIYYKGLKTSQIQLPKLNERSQPNIKTDRSISIKRIDYTILTERIQKPKDKLIQFLRTRKSSIWRNKKVRQRSGLKNRLPILYKDQNSINTQVSQQTQHFEKSESEISRISHSSQSSIKSDQSESRFKEFSKDITKIKQKMQNELEISFFSFIKNQDRLKDIIQNFKPKEIDNPLYFYCLNQQLFPKRIDLSSCLIENKISLQDLKINSNYFPLLSQLLKSKKCKKVKSILLSNNHLREESLSLIINSFPLILKELNISQNELGKKGAQLLTQLFQKLKHLKYLNIASNFLGDQGCQIILQSLPKTLTKLNLSQNQITDQQSQLFYQFLIQNQNVEVLVLNWNQLGSESGNAIAKALQTNKGVQVLDLSYNHIKNIDEWCILIIQSSSLKHLDISYNQFTDKALLQFSEALKQNHSLYGLHIEGNRSPVLCDQFGFLHLQNTFIKQKRECIDDVNYLPLNGLPLIDVCWICQGWSEFQFLFTPIENMEHVPIFVHLNFLDYKPLPMTSSYEMKAIMKEQHNNNKHLEITTGEIIHQLKQITEQDKKITMAAIQEAYQDETYVKQEQIQEKEEFSKLYYVSYQMCPPKQRILYFFSDPIRQRYFCDQNTPIIQSPIDDQVLQGKDPKHQFHIYDDNTIIEFRRIDYVNELNTKQEFIIDDKNNYKPLIKVQPRSLQKKFALKSLLNSQLKKKHNTVILWLREQSQVFRSTIGDSTEILDQSFEFDWNCSKINRFVKNEYERMKLKEYLRERYQLLKDIYKLYSSNSKQEVFCIPFNNFYQITSTLIDGKYLKFSDVESDLVSIKNNVDSRYIYNPEKTLIRYQFIELIVRLANDKYISSGQCKNFADAVYRLLKEIEQSYEVMDNLQQWREERLWTKEIDLLITIKLQFLKKLYEYITDLTNKKWYFRLKWISLKEFKEFCKSIIQGLNEEQISIIFNFSMTTQIDEVTQDRYMRMSFNEFIEALGRLSEYISPAPVGEDINAWPTLSRQLQPLHIKLESLLTHIYLKLNKQNDFEQFYNIFYLTEDNKYNFMPQLFDKPKSDEFHNSIIQLQVYNTLAFLNCHKQPYIHPNYKIFLKQSEIGYIKRNQVNPTTSLNRQTSNRTGVFEQQIQIQKKKNNLQN